MLQTINDIYYRLPQGMINMISTLWYIRLAAMDRDADMLLMNYGWAALDDSQNRLELLPGDEKDRYCIQLYHRTAAAINLRGLDVLEVGCGRGGGASYIQRYLAPRSMTGLDRTAPGIRFCKRHYSVPGLEFVQGMAQALKFAPGSFDALVNIESSHCYNNLPRFWENVHRVLKPGGHFLLADYRDAKDIDTLRRQLDAAGFVVREEENISPNVSRALDLDNARKMALIEKKIPSGYRLFFKEFAGTVGTRSMYAALRSGEIVYMRFLLQRV